MSIRICPKRDAVCPHGMACPFVIDRYECKPEPHEAPQNANNLAARKEAEE